MRILYVFGFLILAATGIYGQSYILTGIVTDAETGEPLIGATVTTSTSSESIMGTVTDVDGSFALEMRPADLGVMVDYLGYENLTLPVEGNGEDMILNIALSATTTILETTTITGSRYEKSLASSPVSINVIKPQLLENTNTTIVDKILEKIPGVQIIDGQANIRGGSGYSYGAGSRVLLLIDDVPAFQADAGRPLWDDIPVENIAQIEVLKGASSALYGSAAMNGIINIRTGYATSEPQTKANVSYTHFMPPSDARKKWWDKAPYQVNAGILHKQKFGKLDVVGAGFFEKLNGYNKNLYKDRYRLSANLKYRFSDRINLAVNTMYNKKDDGSDLLWNDPASGAYVGWIDPDDPDGLGQTYVENQTNRFYIDPQLTIYDNKNNKHKLITRYYLLKNGSTTGQGTSSENFFSEYQYTSNLNQLDLDYTLGGSGYFSKSNAELYGGEDLNANNLAVYGQLEKSFGESLTLTFGSRYEYNYHNSPEVMVGDSISGGRISEDRVVSRFGLNYKMAKYTNLRASWGQGYRFPTLAERFVRTQLGSFSILPNPELTSETGWTAEMGVKQGVSLLGWTGYIDLAVFTSRYQNMMEFTFQPNSFGFQSKNVGDTEIQGLEVNVVGRSEILGLPFNVLLGYTYINPRYRNFEDDESLSDEEREKRAELRAGVSLPNDPNADPNILKYRNRHNFKTDMELFWNDFSIGGAFNYTSEMVTIDQFLSALNGISDYRAVNGSFSKVDVRVAYSFSLFKVSLIANNVLNKEYSIRPGVLEAPSNISLRWDTTF